MEDSNSITKSASVKKQTSPETTKGKRLNGCFPAVEIPIDPTVKSLKHLDSQKLKEGIRQWAKAVVAYGRQVSHWFGSN